MLVSFRRKSFLGRAPWERDKLWPNPEGMPVSIRETLNLYSSIDDWYRPSDDSNSLKMGLDYLKVVRKMAWWVSFSSGGLGSSSACVYGVEALRASMMLAPVLPEWAKA